MKWNINDFIEVTQAQLFSKKETEFNQVSIDTRNKDSINQGAFFAITKKGHAFAKDALDKKAHILVVESVDTVQDLKNKITVLKVKDTVKALQQWSYYWRNKLNFEVVAITGSNGKTSTKHFCKTLFEDDPSVLASPQSYNNHLGVPLSLLQADNKTRFIIQEIGANAVGEIEHLCSIALPNIAVCTMVGSSHLKGFQNIETTAQEKEKIYYGSKNTKGVFNLDNPWTLKMKAGFKNSLLTFSSQNKNADIYLQITKMQENSLDVSGHIQGETGTCQVALAGQQHLPNIMASTGLALFMGEKPKNIWEKLPLLKSPKGRFQLIDVPEGQILFDAYNSNPESMKAFLEYISFLSQKKSCVLCLGDMLELGEQTAEFHKKLGQQVANMNIEHIYYIGQYRFDFEKGLKEAHCQTPYELLETCPEGLSSKIFSQKPKSLLAIKASRGLQLEKAVDNVQII